MISRFQENNSIIKKKGRGRPKKNPEIGNPEVRINFKSESNISLNPKRKMDETFSYPPFKSSKSEELGFTQEIEAKNSQKMPDWTDKMEPENCKLVEKIPIPEFSEPVRRSMVQVKEILGEEDL